MVAINDRHAVSQMKGYKRTVGDWGYDIVTEHQIGLGGSDKRTTCSQYKRTVGEIGDTMMWTCIRSTLAVATDGRHAVSERKESNCIVGDWGYDIVKVHK